MGLVSIVCKTLVAFNLIPHCGQLDTKPNTFEVEKVHIVSKQQNEKVADLKPEFALKDSVVELYAVIKAKENGKIVYITEAESIKLRRRIPKNRMRKPQFADFVNINWNKVEADSNGNSYDNKNEDGIGVSIPYVNTKWKKGWSVLADVHPTTLEDQFPTSTSGLGTMRYMINVTHNENLHSTIGGKELTIKDGSLSAVITKRRRVEKRLAKVVYRNNEGNATDYAFEMFNSPYIWGSYPGDVDSQIGSDCADLVVYGHKRDGQANNHRGKRQKYTWSSGLKGFTNLVAKPVGISYNHLVDEDGAKIPWGKVRQGDVVLQPGHAAILYQDNGDGYLGAGDTMIETLFKEPRIVEIRADIEVRRWRK
jgi:hypothetical protein